MKLLCFVCPMVLVIISAACTADLSSTGKGFVAGSGTVPAPFYDAVSAADDENMSNQWGLVRIGAPQARELCAETADTVIAVLDTGIYGSHPDLKGVLSAEANFSESPIALDINGHGTHIAGIITATAGGSPLMNVKVADDSGRFASKAAAEGIVWAVDHGAAVINISMVDREPLMQLEKAVDYAWEKGVVVVAAAGNHISGQKVYPAYYGHCIAVTAADSGDKLAEWSNYDNWVDVAAPGVDIYSTMPFNEYGIKSGTSMAAAYVSGIAGMLMAVAEDVNGNGYVNDEVRTAIEAGCDPLFGPGPEAGRISAPGALKCLPGLQ